MKAYLARGLAFFAALAAFALFPAVAQAPRSDFSPQKIEIRAHAIEGFELRDPSQRRFGALDFRGGLILESTNRDFGGISALRVGPDGASFLSLSDRGNWLRGRIVYRDGRPIAIADAEMAPVLGADGTPLNKRGWYDTEALTGDGGTLYVAIERVNQIVRFDYGKDGLRARGRPIPVPAAMKKLPHNKSIECLAMAPAGGPLAGTLIAIAERGLDAQGNLQGFLIGGAGGAFSLQRSDEFDVSDCTVTPGGDLLVLERRFSWTRGVAMRIRRVPLAAIKSDALVDGPQLIFADMGHQIDNMEGMALHRAGDGALVLTLISDDNFSALQRTLLLQFTLIGE